MKDNNLVKFWKEQIENSEEVNLEDAALKLQRQAEISVAEAKDNWLNAKTNLRTLKLQAKDNHNFSQIVDAFVEVSILEKEYTISLETYKDMFGEDPKLLSTES